ncbi:hypothetical protein GCM10010435_25320 [Winogradskya consettensis]|uniref:HTH luxR-type domain-containing protein n=1 Tax=Winogradskya consettensis TaxID=113560 RepID=A0A919SAB0_9ACTN|nr:LuxR family transcriptional regulator [Actinoplanes consettensis]GIM67848.1 hypothetical protein Aco04nite_08110 [Actinoplanes consettensis]
MTAGTHSREFVGRPTQRALLEECLRRSADQATLIDVAGEPGIGKTRLLEEWAQAARAAGVTVDTEATTPAGRVVIIDDLHLADAATAARVLELLRRPAATGGVLILAYRPRQTDPGLLAAIASAAARWSAHHLPLGPLTRGESTALVGAQLCGHHRATCYEESGGIPRYLEILAATCSEGGCRPTDSTDALVPQLAAAPLLAELGRLPESTRLVAHAAAVLGDPLSPGLLPEVAQLDLAGVLDAMDELLAEDVLRPGPATGSFVFRHPVLRRVCYSAARGGWRLGAHQRAATALHRSGAAATEYADHVQRAVTATDGSGLTVLTEAAEAASTAAPATAANWYDAALRLLPPDPANRRQRAGLLLGLITTTGSTGRYAECRAALEQHATLAAGTEYGTQSTTATLWHARMTMLDGRREAARDHLRAALATDPGHREAARLMVELAAQAVQGGVLAFDDPAHADLDAWCDDAVMATASGEDELLRAYALTVKATVRLAHGGVTAAQRGSHAAAQIVDSRADTQVASRLEALVALGWLEVHLERYAAATRHFGRARAVAIATGRRPVVLAAAIGLGRVQLLRGDLSAAQLHAEEALRLTDIAPAAEPLAAARCLSAAVSAETGDVTTAVDQARAALAALAGATGSPWYAQARTTLTGTQIAAGAAASCGSAPEHPAPSWDTVAGPVLAGRIAAATGDDDRARELAARAQQAAADSGLPGQIAEASLFAAEVAARPSDALTLAAIAGTAAATADRQLLMGRARLAAGRALTALGDPARATEHLTAAAEVATRTGSGSLALAVTAAAPVQEEQLVLSKREFEIAQLVSLGRTNRQIARTLEVSHKTIETHLGRIFVKLDVSSRAEIANMVGRAVVAARPARVTSRPTP